MSGHQRRVILYGDSLVLEGVRANLERCPDLQVFLLGPSQDKPLDAIRACCPTAVVFDMGATRPDFLLSLLLQPDLLLIGIDPETHQALAWSGRQVSAVAAADLVNVIRQQDADSETLQ